MSACDTRGQVRGGVWAHVRGKEDMHASTHRNGSKVKAVWGKPKHAILLQQHNVTDHPAHVAEVSTCESSSMRGIRPELDCQGVAVP